LKLHALDAATGAEAWAVDTAYAEGTEIAGCSFYRNKVWLLHNPPLKGIKDRKGNEPRGAELLLAGPNKREVDAFAAAAGKKLFRCDFGVPIAGLSFAGGKVFGSSQHGAGDGIAILDADSGTPLWKRLLQLKCTPSLASANCCFTHTGSP